MDQTYETIKGLNSYIDSLHYKENKRCLVKDKKRVKNIIDNLISIETHRHFQFAPFYNWIILTFDPKLSDDSVNSHYQEISFVLDYLSKQEEDKSNFRLMAETVFQENYVNLKDFFSKVFTLFSFKDEQNL